MKPIFSDRIDEESRGRRIRALFSRYPDATIFEFTGRCIDDGMFTPAELRSLEIKGAESVVRKALKHPDETGLPFAGPTAECREGTNVQVWRQRDLWEFEDYEHNYNLLRKHAGSTVTVCNNLARECDRRYGRRPGLGLLTVVQMDASTGCDTDD
jgi:hypothetical protein